MQQEVNPQKDIDTRVAAGAPRLQSKRKSANARRIDFKVVKRAARFERVLAYYGIELAGGRGAQRRALCPFHRDTQPSLNVNFEMKLFNCFVCGDGGDIVKFVAKKEYPSNPEGHLLEAAGRLAEICGIRVEHHRRNPPANPAARVASRNRDLTTANPPLDFQLKVDPTHPYLVERGLSPEMVETFGLGHCLNGRSMMRQRIVIPIHNERGELVAHAGRWPGNSGWPEGMDKYMLPPKFQKMRVLFNLNRVIDGLFKSHWSGHEQHVVVVEGFFGVFAIHQLAPCVALMGSVISGEHIRLLRDAKFKFVTLLLDGPSKAQAIEKSAIRDQKSAATACKLSVAGFFVTTPKLGAGEQPDTIDRKRLEQLISSP